MSFLTLSGQTGSAAGSVVGLVVYIAFFAALIYFMILRPQKKQKIKMDNLMNSMEVGDSVLTTGGMYGIIIDIADDTVIVEFGNNKNCRIPMQKTAIVELEKANQN